MTPKTTADEIHTAAAAGFVGLKCYHCFAPPDSDGNTYNAHIAEYLPEHVVQAANDHGLSITLHMVRNRALSDTSNSATIVRYCRAYPNIKLILAHAARGFNMHHTIDSLGTLRGLSNGVCGAQRG